MRRATVTGEQCLAIRGEKQCLASLNPFIERQSQPKSVRRPSYPPLKTGKRHSSTGLTVLAARRHQAGGSLGEKPAINSSA